MSIEKQLAHDASGETVAKVLLYCDEAEFNTNGFLWWQSTATGNCEP